MDRRLIIGAGLAGISFRPSTAQTRDRYIGHLRMEALRDGRLMRLLEPFTYVDPAGTSWPVPARAVVDGASIPRVFWPVVGGPWVGVYRDASVVHDWYCAVRTMPWKQTHRMFYDAMLTSQVPRRQARLMFLAVRYAGPSWDDLTLANSRLLTNNGQRRLDPPGSRRAANGFATAAAADEAANALRDKLIELSMQAEQADLDVQAMERLVDAGGRAETTAAMLEP